MSFNADSIAEEVRKGIEALIGMASGEEGGAMSADQMERQMWWQLLEVGRQLMQLFFAARSRAEEAKRVVEREGEEYPYKGQRERDYLSVFGRVKIERRAYWKRGVGSVFPLDESLSLPSRVYSDWVQEIVGEMSVKLAYEEAVGWVEKWLPIRLPKRAAQQIVVEHAEEVDSYYEQRPAPRPATADRILAVSADGKGIPMNREHSPPPETRRGKGGKKTAKKEATVTSIYSIAPWIRTPEDILRALLPEQPAENLDLPRPEPTGKRTFGTLAGKEAAFEHLAHQVAQRDNELFTDRVALTDGSPALPLKVEAYLPDFTLVLDLIHVSEYLWDAANALLGETHPERNAWVREALHCLLADDHQTLFERLEKSLSQSDLSSSQRKTLTTVLNYLRRNLPFMDYQTYLARGWPIATGVIEGACRHLVKDRFELSGMRWSVPGAQAMLDLRAVALNGDWDDFQRFRRQSTHQQRFGSPHPEICALALAA
jgi:hypothetical protein